MAQFENELSLKEGEMVYLRRYVDCEWLEGDIDRKKERKKENECKREGGGDFFVSYLEWQDRLRDCKSKCLVFKT